MNVVHLLMLAAAMEGGGGGMPIVMMLLAALVVLVLVVFAAVIVVVLVVVFKKQAQNMPERQDPDPVYFPPDGLTAVLEEKYVMHGEGRNPVHWVRFRDGENRNWNLPVQQQFYERLQEGQSGWLVLTPNEETVARFGELVNHEAIRSVEESVGELEVVESGWVPDLAGYELSGKDRAAWERFHGGESLPEQTVALHLETDSLQAVEPGQILQNSELPQFLKWDRRLAELAGSVYREALQELSCYEGMPREGTAGNFIDYNGSRFSLFLTLKEQAVPLQSSVDGELVIK